MEYSKPIDAESITVSFSDTVVTAFDNTALVPLGDIRRYNFHDYKALTNIYELATYSWNNISSTIDGVTTKLDDKTIVDSTAVPCIQNVTTIYVIDSYKDIADPQDAVGKFFLYTGTNQDVDFTTIDPNNPSNFDIVINYRFEDIFPDENSLFWEDLGAINSRRLIDRIIKNPTIAPSGNEMTYEFIYTTSTNVVAFFDINCSSIEISRYRYNSVSELYDIEVMPLTVFELKSVEGIIDSYTWHLTELAGNLDRLLVRLPIWSNTKTIVTFKNTVSAPEVGEAIFGRAISLGTTLDEPTGTRKSFSKTKLTADGKRIVSKSSSIIDKITYRVIIPTTQVDSKIKTIGELLEENLLIIGDESGRFTTLTSFGYASELPFKVKSNSNMNEYGLTINTLI